MDSVDALRHMVEASGKSTRQIAREIGRSDSFIRATIAQKSRPRIDTFLAIAHACGYEVSVSSPSDRFELTRAVAPDLDSDAPSIAYAVVPFDE